MNALQAQPRPWPDGGTADPRLWVRIADDLRGKLAAGQITAGDLVTITALTRQWDVCRQTAAKALHTLEEDGLLTRYPGHGYYATQRS
jgi:DNA-binding GntR family transcriptional regulator